MRGKTIKSVKWVVLTEKRIDLGSYSRDVSIQFAQVKQWSTDPSAAPYEDEVKGKHIIVKDFLKLPF